MRGSFYLRWSARAALALTALVVTANLATSIAFSETAVRARVAQVVSQPSLHGPAEGERGSLRVVPASPRAR